MNNNMVAYVYANETHYGVHKYNFQETEKAFNGPAKYVHTSTGYGMRADGDWVEPINYYDESDTCEDSISGVLAGIISANSEIVYVAHPTVLRAHRDWLPNWIKNDFKTTDGKDIKCKKLWMELHKVLPDVKLKPIIESDPGYVHAMLICNLYTELSNERDDIIPYTPKYWVNAIPRDPLLAFNQLCFNTHTHQPGTYLIADVKASIYDVGRQANFVGYSIVIMNEPDKYIEHMYDSVSGNLNTDVLGHVSLDRLFNKDITRDVIKYGDVIVQPSGHRNDYNFVGDGSLLIGEVKPAGLMRLGLENFARIYKILMLCKDVNELETVGLVNLRSVCITDLIRDGKKLLKSLPVGTSHIKLPHPLDHSKEYIYKLGKSLPNRNKLAALSRVSANFYLVHWESSENMVRFAIYVETPTGKAIYCNYYTDIIVK